jgi:hypothetical protein
MKLYLDNCFLAKGIQKSAKFLILRPVQQKINIEL